MNGISDKPSLLLQVNQSTAAENNHRSKSAADIPQAALPRDSFDKGQWWKNRTSRSGRQTTVINPTSGSQAYDLFFKGQESVKKGNNASQAAVEQNDQERKIESPPRPKGNDKDSDRVDKGQGTQKKQNGEPLNQSDKLRIAHLKKADAAIHTHETAHLNTAGAYARGGPTYEYERGPDGKHYAVHGEVPIDTSREIKPEDTVKKMRVVRAAALAPSNPSPQDLKVAAKASSTIVDAKKELGMQRLAQEKAKLRKAEREMQKVEEAQKEDAGKNQPPQPLDGAIPQQKKIMSPPDGPPTFNVNSAAKQMVNLAQYQYFGLNIIA